MEIGTFSINLAVKNLQASKVFYRQLGFEVVDGNEEQNWLILKNGAAVVGLFQGMFEKNIMTFDSGWDADANELDSFTDVRDLQKTLRANGISITEVDDGNSTGPAHFTLADPDGNSILIDLRTANKLAYLIEEKG